jgi:hypothetical protein
MKYIYGGGIGAAKQKWRPDFSSAETGRSAWTSQNAMLSRPYQ